MHLRNKDSYFPSRSPAGRDVSRRHAPSILMVSPNGLIPLFFKLVHLLWVLALLGSESRVSLRFPITALMNITFFL